MTTQWFYNSSVQRFHGLSTDTKPTDCTNGSVFIELDTAKIYLFNEAALTWHAIPANGSGNYNDLSNKPSINGVTLSGDKSLADIGIVNPLIIKGRVDSENDLPGNAQTGWVYFVGLTTDEDLDEYVYTADGEWELLGTSHIVVDSALSTTSENPVQNKVITNALNSKVGMEEVYGRGTQIPNGSDLHDYTTPGVYYCGSTADARTLLNCPVENAFRLVVTNIVSDWGENTRIRHDLYPSGSVSSAVYSENLGTVTTAYPDGWRPWGVMYNVIDAVPTSGSQYAVSSGGVYDALSTLTPISESAYEALTTKDKPLYFIYD